MLGLSVGTWADDFGSRTATRGDATHSELASASIRLSGLSLQTVPVFRFLPQRISSVRNGS